MPVFAAPVIQLLPVVSVVWSPYAIMHVDTLACGIISPAQVQKLPEKLFWHRNTVPSDNYPHAVTSAPGSSSSLCTHRSVRCAARDEDGGICASGLKSILLILSFILNISQHLRAFDNIWWLVTHPVHNIFLTHMPYGNYGNYGTWIDRIWPDQSKMKS